VTSVVFDASALIAFLRGEPGAEVVRERLVGSIISAMNYSEVLKKTIEVGGSADVVRAHVGSLPIRIDSFSASQAVATASLYPLAKPHGLSFADRACLALGIQENAEVLTTEKNMAKTDMPVRVMLIRGNH